MALFNISVQSWLNLPESVRMAIVKTAVDTGRIAAALEAIVAKIDEANEVPTALHDVIEETAASADQVKAAQEQQGP